MIKTVAEYLHEVNKVIGELSLTNTSTTAWFRGHADEEWKLIPSIFRYNRLISYERDINRDFKLLTERLMNENYPKDDFEWLYIMQHYGMPTRLLDWSESSLVGLFFAVEDYNYDTDACVWVLSPRVYNYLILAETNTVPTSKSPYLFDYMLQPDNGPNPTRQVKAAYPLALRPVKNSARILAQKGVFTIHGNQDICINDIANAPNDENLQVLRQIKIDKRYKKSILKELYQSGISHSVLFPELPGVSKELTTRYTQFFKPK
jgi:hypothetical protein